MLSYYIFPSFAWSPLEVVTMEYPFPSSVLKEREGERTRARSRESTRARSRARERERERAKKGVEMCRENRRSPEKAASYFQKHHAAPPSRRLTLSYEHHHDPQRPVLHYATHTLFTRRSAPLLRPAWPCSCLYYPVKYCTRVPM